MMYVHKYLEIWKFFVICVPPEFVYEVSISQHTYISVYWSFMHKQSQSFHRLFDPRDSPFLFTEAASYLRLAFAVFSIF